MGETVRLEAYLGGNCSPEKVGLLDAQAHDASKIQLSASVEAGEAERADAGA